MPLFKTRRVAAPMPDPGIAWPAVLESHLDSAPPDPELLDAFGRSGQLVSFELDAERGSALVATANGSLRFAVGDLSAAEYLAHMVALEPTSYHLVGSRRLALYARSASWECSLLVLSAAPAATACC